MKKLLALLGAGVVLLIASCNPSQDRDPNYVAPKPKFEKNTLVYVGETEYIVSDTYINMSNKRIYYLKKVDCRSDYCYYDVKESEITKQKRSEIAMEKLMNQDTIDNGNTRTTNQTEFNY